MLTPVAPGSVCAAGGTQIDVGVDVNGNGELDAAEVQQTAVVCNGTSNSGSGGASNDGGPASGGAAGAAGTGGGGVDAGPPPPVPQSFEFVSNGRVVYRTNSPTTPGSGLNELNPPEIVQICLPQEIGMPWCPDADHCPYCTCDGAYGSPFPQATSCTPYLGPLDPRTCTYPLPAVCSGVVVLQGPGMSYPTHDTPTVDPPLGLYCEDQLNDNLGPILVCYLDFAKSGTTRLSVMWQ